MGLRDRLSAAAKRTQQAMGRSEQITEDEMSKMGNLAHEIQQEERHEEHVVKLREETLENVKEVSKDFRKLEEEEDNIRTWDQQFLNGSMDARQWFKNVKGRVTEMNQIVNDIEQDMKTIHQDIVQADQEERNAASEDEKIEELVETVDQEFQKFEELQQKLNKMENEAEERAEMGYQGENNSGYDPKSKSEMQ